MKNSSDLPKRIITGAAVSLVITLCLVFSDKPFVLPSLMAVLSFIGVGEILSSAGLKKRNVFYWLISAVLTAVIFIEIKYFKLTLLCTYISAIIIFIILMVNLKSFKKIPSVLAGFTAAAVVMFFKSSLYILKESGVYLLAAAFLVSAVTDIMAYFVGRAIGKHKLAPTLSPKKTVEGSIGGSICAMGVLLLVAFILNKTGAAEFNYIALAAYLLLASLIGQFGDLAFSTFKRITGIKDFGRLLPGHGGILDRFDSTLFVLPFTYLFYLIF